MLAGIAIGLTGVLVVGCAVAACEGISRSPSLGLSPGPSRSARSTISSSSSSTMRVPALPVASSQCGGEWLCFIIRGLSSGDRGVVPKNVMSSSVSALVRCWIGDTLLPPPLQFGAMAAARDGGDGPDGTDRGFDLLRCLSTQLAGRINSPQLPIRCRKLGSPRNKFTWWFAPCKRLQMNSETPGPRDTPRPGWTQVGTPAPTSPYIQPCLVVSYCDPRTTHDGQTL